MAAIGATAASAVRIGGKVRGGERSGKSIAFLIALWLSLLLAFTFLIILLVTTFIDGVPRLDSNLLTRYTSSFPSRAGARAAILGSLWVVGFCALMAIPLGIAAAVYLEEFADANRWYNRLFEVNVQNLAAVPAIIYGMLAVGVLALFGVGNKSIVIGGSIALALLILPVIIITTREALRSVPREIREGSLALGATPLQTVWRQTLPGAIPGISTGTILALSRAIGEAAPLLLLGGLVFVTYDPNGLFSGFTTMPIQIFNWVQLPQAEFKTVASAAIIVLLAILLAMNGLAIYIRNHFQRRW
jgi:phosphate ABC transporter permease subunit PstA